MSGLRWPKWVLYSGVGTAMLPVLVLGLGKAMGQFTQGILFLQLLILCAAGIVAVGVAANGKNFYFTPLLLTMLYVVSYPLRALDMELNPDLFASSYATGLFSFTADDYWHFIAVSSIGIAGIGIGIVAMRHLLHLVKVRPAAVSPVVTSRLRTWIWVWFSASLMMGLLAMQFQIGALTLEPIHLPFKLTGFIALTRPYLPTWTGLWLFGLAVRQGDRRAAWQILIMIVILGVVAGLATLGKGAMVSSLLPFILYLTIMASKSAITKSFQKWFILLVVLLLPVSIITASWLRVYTVRFGERPSFATLLQTYDVGSMFEDTGLTQFLFLHSFRRFSGANETMAVASGEPLDSLQKHFVLVLSLPGWQEVQSESIHNVFQFNDYESRAGGFGPVTGKAYGLFGLGYLTHNWFILLLITAFASAMSLLIEGVFNRFGSLALNAGISFMACMLIWEGAVDQVQGLVFSLLLMYTGLYLLSQLRKAPRESSKVRCVKQTASAVASAEQRLTELSRTRPN